MKRILANGEAAFLDKLRRLPDGVWRDRTYVECCRPGDRGTYRVALSLRKEGDRLIFENDGTAPQQGAMNATYSGWRGSIMVALNQLLCWDQFFSPGGALRHVEFDPTPGTLNCASFPASVSTAPVQAMEISLYPAYNVLSKMIFADPEMRQDVMCIGGTSQWPATIFRGIDQWGENYGYLLIDPIGGAIGAFSTQDGISTGGQSRTPICKLPNIEHTEQTFPLLFLYRKEVQDSGGPGRWRGGLSAESCFIPHNAERVVQDTLSSGNAIPTSTGMMGGYPGTTNIYRFVRHSDILERLARREMVDDIAQVRGETVTLGLRQENFEQLPADVYAVVWTAAGGFGDPMERDPELVFADWQNGAVSAAAARDIYGVVIAADGLDAAATAALRQAVRRDRIARAQRTPPRRLTGPIALVITDNLRIRIEGGTPHHSCAKCDADLGPTHDNYKDHCLREDRPVAHAVPLSGDPHRYIDAEPQFRQFFCPGCGALVENEVALATEPVLHDIAIVVDESEPQPSARRRRIGTAPDPNSTRSASNSLSIGDAANSRETSSSPAPVAPDALHRRSACWLGGITLRRSAWMASNVEAAERSTSVVSAGGDASSMRRLRASISLAIGSPVACASIFAHVVSVGLSMSS